jgi:hypothetical protein
MPSAGHHSFLLRQICSVVANIAGGANRPLTGGHRRGYTHVRVALEPSTGVGNSVGMINGVPHGFSAVWAP